MSDNPPQSRGSALFRSARSFLFVPATRPERIVKALASGADAVIVDLEDAVAPADKNAARLGLAQSWEVLNARQRERILVRTNAATTTWYQDDCRLLGNLSRHGLVGVVLPKAESVADLDALAQALPAAALLPLIESAQGLHAIDLLARAPGVLRLVFGHLDFQADIGMHCGPDESELASVRLAMVLASRRAGLAPPVDGVTADMEDATRLEADVLRCRRMGFSAKLCIHPRQAPVVNQAFYGTTAERAWAQRVLQASREQGPGAFRLDGQMVDAPVLQLALSLLQQRDPSMTIAPPAIP